MVGRSAKLDRAVSLLGHYILISSLAGSVDGRTLYSRATGPTSSTASSSPAAGSDGGSGVFNFVWTGYAILIATPLLVAGLRLTSITSGCGLGLSIGLVVWVAVVNSAPSSGFGSNTATSDLVVTAVPMALSFLAILLGFIRGLHYLGHVLLGGVAGAALALHVVLFKQSLLIPIVPVIYGLMGLLAVLGIVGVVLKQRLGVIVSTAITGGFLSSLAADLIKNGQDGISFGLRVLFDTTGNLATLKPSNYRPDLSTQIILASGLGLVLLSSVAQYFLWPGEFIEKRQSTVFSDLGPPPPDSAIQRFVRRRTRYFAPSVSSEEQLMAAVSSRGARPWQGAVTQPARAPAAFNSAPSGSEIPGQGMSVAQRQVRSIQGMAAVPQARAWQPPVQHAGSLPPSQTSRPTRGVPPPSSNSSNPSSVSLWSQDPRPVHPAYFDPSSARMRPPTSFRPTPAQSLPLTPKSPSRAPTRQKSQTLTTLRPSERHRIGAGTLAAAVDSGRESRPLTPMTPSPASEYPPSPPPIPLDSASSLAYTRASPQSQDRRDAYGFPSTSSSARAPPQYDSLAPSRHVPDSGTREQPAAFAPPSRSNLLAAVQDQRSNPYRQQTRTKPRRYLPPSQTRI